MDALATAKVVIIRTGFSTHAINMGQRHVQLDSTYTGNSDGSATLHVQQLPANPAILAPGPAMLFVVVNGTPSVGVWIMVGSGQIGPQTMNAVNQLPSSSVPAAQTGTNSGNKSDATRSRVNAKLAWLAAGLIVGAAAML